MKEFAIKKVNTCRPKGFTKYIFLGIIPTGVILSDEIFNKEY